MSRKNSNVSVSIIIRFLTHDEKPNCWMSEQRWKNKQLQSVGTSIVCDQEPQWCDWFIVPRFACVDFDIWLSLLIVFLNTKKKKKKKKKSQPPGISSRLTWGVGWIFHYYGLCRFMKFLAFLRERNGKGFL